MTPRPPPKGFKTKVRIFSQKWEIVYVDSMQPEEPKEPKKKKKEGEEEEEEEQEEYGLGSSEGYLRRIVISLAQCRESMIDTLIHEIAHSYMRMLPGCADGWEHPDSERGEEAAVVAVTSVVIDLMRSNPWISELVLDEESSD